MGDSSYWLEAVTSAHSVEETPVHHIYASKYACQPIKTSQMQMPSDPESKAKMTSQEISGEVNRRKSPICALNASWIAISHAACAYSAFIAALIVGCWLHYHKIVQNSSFGYPDEWFPSVSAAIGDRYPERSLFQVLIALTSGPRFLLVFFNFITLRQSLLIASYILLASGVARTFTCGGWVYITSTDDHDWHDIFMIGYIVLTVPWTIAVTVLSPKGSKERRGRALTAGLFFLTLIPLVYFFIQHKVHVVAGAYSYYAYFEWSLIILDIGFDTWSVVDFSSIEIQLFGSKIELVESGPSPLKPVEKTPLETSSDFTFFEFVVNTTNSFMFWTTITSLLVCVWYFPLWNMGISGHEAVIAATFVAPLVTAIPPFSYFFQRFPFIARTLTVLFGIGAYKFEDPSERLFSITAGTAFSIIGLSSEMGTLQNDSKKRTSLWVSLLLGLLATSVFKFMCHSNNPAWPIMHKENGGYNEYALFVGIVAALFTRKSQPVSESIEWKGGSLFLASLGLGGYLFCVQSFLSDSSTMVYWLWEGYPVRGPTPLTGALPHLAAFAIGILTSIKAHPNVLWRPSFFIFGSAGAFILYLGDHWIGFAGSLVFTFYLAALAPVIGQSVAGYNPALLFSCAYFVNIFISLASVWTVAYAFVPYGPLLRERSDIVLGTAVFLIIFSHANYILRTNASKIYRIEVRGSEILLLTIKVLTVLTALSVATFIHRTPTAPFKPFNESSKTFTAGIWCVHFGLDNDMWSSETRMRDLIRDAQVDIIGLLESDTERLIGGNRDFTQTIANDLGMYVDFGPGPNKHTWGAALLSKFPIVSSSHHLLPSPVGELAPAILATLEIYGELVDVVVFHSGQEEDVEDRRLQSLGVADIMANSTRPLVLLSYLVTNPLEGNYNTYVSEHSRMHDIDSTDWDRWCEYILFRGLKKVAYARISRSTITDTELQVAKFKLLNEEQSEYPEEFLYGNHFVDESEVDPKYRMPLILKGDGVRGHRYHVFDEPRYFAERME